VRLVRAHGLGNDYLVLEDGGPLDAGRVRALCDRHTGVGGDGILEPMTPVGADYGVRIWNPDGSVAEKSGNGLRIYARWLRDGGAAERFTVWTGYDVVTCDVGDASIAVQMGRARVGQGVLLAIGGGKLPIVPVDIGNPHAVVFRDGSLDALPWRAWGRELETHKQFPNRTNVQIAAVRGSREVEIRIWERGAGETSASGSSSCAVAAAAVATGRLSPGVIMVHMPGGTLHVAVSAELDVVLDGPVEVIGRIEVDPRWIATR
jgi:diaminopimelate epimerase